MFLGRMRAWWILTALLGSVSCGDGGTRAVPAARRQHPGSSTLRIGRDTVIWADTALPGVANATWNGVAFSGWARARGGTGFDSWPESLRFHGTPAPPNFVTAPQSRRYQTVLRAGAMEGPNFADHFTVVTWGCGSPCTQFAIVDARDGRIAHYDVASWHGAPPMFRRDSRLLVFDPTLFALDSANHPIFPVVEYYVWTGEKLRLLDTVVVDRVRLRWPGDTL